MPHSPIVVVAHLELKPGSEDALIAALEPAITAAHAEDGCLLYALHRDTEQPTRFVFVEKWASLQALEEHGAAPYIEELGARLADLVVGSPDVRILDPVPLGDAGRGAV